MAVPGRRGHLRTTANGTFVRQTFGGTILGNTTTNSIITKSFGLMDALQDNSYDMYNVEPREFSSGVHIYMSRKILSGGAFAYNAAKARTWLISRFTSSLAGVANTRLLFMAQGALRRPILDFQHDFGARMLTQWRANLFSWTGLMDNGNKIKSRRLWLTAGSRNTEGGAAPTSLTTVNMWDLTDGNASNKAVDSAATPTRAIPGELVMKVDFVTVKPSLNGGDFYDYKPITGM